jgi:hypothetical protein
MEINPPLWGGKLKKEMYGECTLNKNRRFSLETEVSLPICR